MTLHTAWGAITEQPSRLPQARLAVPAALAAAVILLCAAPVVAAPPLRLVVSPGGRLPSLEAALASARRLRQGPDARRSLRIEMQGGVYRLQGPVRLTPADSGTPSAPTAIAAAKGARVVITGGRRLTGWLKRGREWVAPLPAGVPVPNQLFVNGRRRTRARTPNEGAFTVDGSIDGAWTWGPNGSRLGSDAASFRYRPGDILPQWATSGRAEVVALQVWAELRMPIRAVDEAARRVTLSAMCCPSNRERDARYWVENAPECLDAPGEWYADPVAREVRTIAMPDEDPRRCVVEAPALTELLRVEGDPAAGRLVHDVRVEGIEFRCADWRLPADGYVDVQAAFDIPAAVTLTGAERVAFARCRFSGLGGWAAEMGRGCRACRLDRCRMEDLGAGGARLGEFCRRPDDFDQSGGHVVERCLVRGIGRVFPAAVGLWIGQSGGNRIEGCEVADTWQSGISAGWSWGFEASAARDNLILRNRVHQIGQGRLSDLGGIYTLGMQPGTRIAGNRVYDVRSRAGGGWGIYLDEGSSGVTVEDNLVYRTTSAGFFLHYGRDNVVRRNVFALSDEPNVLRHRAEQSTGLRFERNIVLCSGGLPLGGEWADSAFTMERNLYWSARGYGLRFGDLTWDQWLARGHDVGSQVADPLFVAPERGDFRLKPGSPAQALGSGPAAGQCAEWPEAPTGSDGG